MSSGPFASSIINKNIIFLKVTNVATMLEIIFLTVIVFSQLMSQIYNDYIENTQKGA